MSWKQAGDQFELVGSADQSTLRVVLWQVSRWDYEVRKAHLEMWLLDDVRWDFEVRLLDRIVKTIRLLVEAIEQMISDD